MHVIEVIPLVKAVAIDTLTYYAATPYPIGTIIDVPIRKQQKRAVVVAVRPASATKAAIKTATFSLRKLPEQSQLSTLPAATIETAVKLSETVPASLGSILFALLPPLVRDGDVTLTARDLPEQEFETAATSVLQATREERYRNYRSIIRETFAHRGSVLLVVPTAADLDFALETLGTGIENRIVTLSSTHTKKKLVQAFAAFDDLSHAKLIIATPAFAMVERHDLTTIIIEGSASPNYKQKTRPYLDVREALRVSATRGGRRMVFGDLLPRSEEEHWRREDIFATEDETPQRLTLPGKLQIVTQASTKNSTDTFVLFHETVLTALTAAHAERQSSFVLAARRGLAPLVVCVDCSHVFRCPDSGEPYSLYSTKHGEEEVRWFVASNSGRRIRAADTCPHCNSWRLSERGIGIQYQQAELKKLLPQVPITLFDHTTATTHKQARRLLAEHREAKGGLLLATPMVLPYLDEPMHTSVIPSLEAARSVPTWRSEESFMRLLLSLRELTSDTLYLQSRSEPDSILNHAKAGASADFYTEELALRESLSYPPQHHFIHLTFEGTPTQVKEQERMLSEYLEAYEPAFYSAPQPVRAGHRRFALIRVAHSKWPEKQLTSLLTALPPSIRIEVDPERIV